MQIPFRWAALRGRYYVHLVQMHGPFPNSVRVGGPLFGGLSSSDSDRDTYFNPDSSQALPVDPEWSRSQALFEDAVGDGTYFADPNCEWEEEVEETKHGGS